MIFLKSMVCIAMNGKIPVVIYVHVTCLEQSQKVWGINWLINTLVRCRIHFWSSYSTNMFLNVVIKKDVAKVPYLKVHGFMTVDIENKLLCYESYLHKTRFYTMNW